MTTEELHVQENQETLSPLELGVSVSMSAICVYLIIEYVLPQLDNITANSLSEDIAGKFLLLNRLLIAVLTSAVGGLAARSTNKLINR